MKLRLLLFFLSLLLILHTSFSALIPPKPELILQRPLDKPYEKVISITLHTKEKYCYVPVFTEGEGYICR
ncbi:hypothetical protein H710_01102 [Bartonella bacilliformis Ver097]|uniref:Uncharacterized protein n=1 Tax=Bartonella bacilliformis Ver097 TaxID=1293911 RepID=A0A072R0Q5_BARBA|nr:hypothetical protein H710_01102 [Bartonella bacilliformis Ver097]